MLRSRLSPAALRSIELRRAWLRASRLSASARQGPPYTSQHFLSSTKQLLWVAVTTQVFHTYTRPPLFQLKLKPLGSCNHSIYPPLRCSSYVEKVVDWWCKGDPATGRSSTGQALPPPPPFAAETSSDRWLA